MYLLILFIYTWKSWALSNTKRYPNMDTYQTHIKQQNTCLFLLNTFYTNIKSKLSRLMRSLLVGHQLDT